MGCLSVKYSLLFQIIVIAVHFCLFLISIDKILEAICGMDSSVICTRLRNGGDPRETERQKKTGELFILDFLAIGPI